MLLHLNLTILIVFSFHLFQRCVDSKSTLAASLNWRVPRFIIPFIFSDLRNIDQGAVAMFESQFG